MRGDISVFSNLTTLGKKLLLSLVVVPSTQWQQSEGSMVEVVGVVHDAGSPADAPLVVGGDDCGKRHPSDLLSRPYNLLLSSVV